MTASTTNSLIRTLVGLTGTVIFSSICLLSATAPAQAATYTAVATVATR